MFLCSAFYQLSLNTQFSKTDVGFIAFQRSHYDIRSDGFTHTQCSLFNLTLSFCANCCGWPMFNGMKVCILITHPSINQSILGTCLDNLLLSWRNFLSIVWPSNLHFSNVTFYVFRTNTTNWVTTLRVVNRVTVMLVELLTICVTNRLVSASVDRTSLGAAVTSHNQSSSYPTWTTIHTRENSAKVLM